MLIAMHSAKPYEQCSYGVNSDMDIVVDVVYVVT